MSAKKISRRTFLKTAGIALGSTALIGAAITTMDKYQPVGTLPRYTFGENNM